MFVFGRPVEGGVSGTNPELSEASDDNNFQLETVQYDYRETIGTLLQDYLGASNEIIDNTFFNHTTNESFNDHKIENLVKDEYNISKLCIKAPVEGLKEDQEWQVFPNPFSDRVVLYSLNEEPTVTYEILTISGAFLMSRQEETTFGRLELYLGHLDTGAYILKVISNNKTEVHKIMKI